MKIAICLSGDLRTFEKCYNSLKENILDVVENTDIFMSIYEREGKEKIEKAISLYNPKKFTIIQMPPNFYDKKYDVLPSLRWKYKNSADFMHNNQCMHFGIKSVLELVPEDYDIIMRIRYDLLFKTPINLLEIDINKFYVGKDHKYPSRNGTDMSVNDAFAFGPLKQMKEYAKFYDHFYNVLDKVLDKTLKECYAPLYLKIEPPSLFKYYLAEIVEINYKESDNKHCLLRENGDEIFMNRLLFPYG